MYVCMYVCNNSVMAVSYGGPEGRAMQLSPLDNSNVMIDDYDVMMDDSDVTMDNPDLLFT